jgi:hypothetical protein
LVGAENREFENSSRFFPAAADAMRRILIERARRRRTRRYGGDFQRVDIEEFDLVAPQADDELQAVNDALDELAKESIPCKPNWLSCVTLTGGPTEEAPQILGLSVSTMNDYWTFSRALLQHHLEGK